MIIAFDIGGTMIKWGVFTGFSLLESGQFSSQSEQGGMAILHQVLRLTLEMKKTYTLEGIAVSAAGVIEPTKGYVRSASQTIKEYIGLPIKTYLQEHTQLYVSVENDVNCALLAEQKQGNAQTSSSTFMMTIGTGVGGAFFLNGAIYHGFCDHAGEVGYLTINDTCLDESGSMRVLLRRIAKRKQVDVSIIDGFQVFQWYRENDQICIEEVHTTMHTIAKAIASIAQLLNPELILLGGGISSEESLILPFIQKQCKLEMSPFLYEHTKIQCASLKNHAGMIGALYHYYQQEHHMINFNPLQ